MVQERIIYILNNPLEVKPTDLLQLQEERKRYPYFYPLTLLQTKAIFNNDDYNDSIALEETSVYASNRKILYDYLNYRATEKQVDQPDANSDNSVDSNAETIENTIQIENEISRNYIESLPTSTPLEIEKDFISTDETHKEKSFIKENISPTEETETIRSKEREKKATFELEKETLEERELLTQANHSFTDWLKINDKPGSDNLDIDNKSEEENNHKEEIEEKFKTIEAFLDKNPKIIPAKEYKPTLDINANQKPNLSHLMTETLANIYVEQNKYDKAIKAYRILRLKYPEKSGYFADRIKEINELKNK